MHERRFWIEAGHGVDLEYKGPVVLIEPEINPGEVIDIERLESLNRQILDECGGLGRQIRRAHLLGLIPFGLGELRLVGIDAVFAIFQFQLEHG